MGIKIDIGDTVNKTIGVCTRFGAFWRGMAFPDNFSPALSFLIVIGILPLIGYFLSAFMWIFWFSGINFFSVFIYAVISAIIGYLFYVFLPIIMGIILAALDPALNINKAKAPVYATVLAYAAAPAAVGALFGFIPIIGWIIGILMWVLALIVTYLAFTEGIGMDSGQAIIMMLIMAVISIVIYVIIFTLVMGMFFTGILFSGMPMMMR